MAITKVQRFETATIHREQIKNAEYNPRIMDKHTKERLKKVLKKKGLVMPLVWNKQTGNLVGGHQRIEQIDSIEGSSDYEMTVAVVDVPMNEEIELNLILNNNSILGEFDFMKVAELTKENSIDLESLGFTMDDLNILEAETGVMLKEPEEIKLETESPEEKAIKEAEKLAKKDEQYKKTMEARKNQIVESMEEAGKEMSSFVVIRFQNLDEKITVMDRMGLDHDTELISPEVLLKLLK